ASKRSTVARGSASAAACATGGVVAGDGADAGADDGTVVLRSLPFGGGPAPIIGKPLTAKKMTPPPRASCAMSATIRIRTDSWRFSSSASVLGLGLSRAGMFWAQRQSLALAATRMWANFSRAAARRVGTCSEGTPSMGAVYPRRNWRATDWRCTSSGPS
ncbi:MAG: hypothetical protein JWO02_219, partial [Solirubrobacterales bacterium]|nr:hypothetical protein [Solirubrobacterales bacterium]